MGEADRTPADGGGYNPHIQFTGVTHGVQHQVFGQSELLLLSSDQYL